MDAYQIYTTAQANLKETKFNPTNFK